MDAVDTLDDTGNDVGTAHQPDPASTGSADERTTARSALGALLGGLVLAVTASFHAPVLVVGVAVVQTVLIVGWVLGTGLPGRAGAIVIALAGAAAADTVVVVWPHSEFGPLLAIFGLAMPTMFLHQMIRGVVRVRVVESLAGVALILVLAVALAAYVQLRHEFNGLPMTRAAAIVAAVSAAVGPLVDLAWSRPRFDPTVARGLTGVVVGTVAGAAAGLLSLRADPVSLHRQLLICVVIGAVVALVSVAMSFVDHSAAMTPERARVSAGAPSADRFAGADPTGADSTGADPTGLDPIGVDPTEVDPIEVARRRPPVPWLRPVPVALLPIAAAGPIAYLLFLSVA